MEDNYYIHHKVLEIILETGSLQAPNILRTDKAISMDSLDTGFMMNKVQPSKSWEYPSPQL